MKKRIASISSIILIFVLFSSCYNTKLSKERVILNLVYNFLKDAHYPPVVFDSEFSIKIYDSYIEYLDYSKRFLLQSDIKKLSKYRERLGDDIRQEDLSFFDTSFNLITKRQAEVKNYPGKILASPINYDSKEILNTDYKNIDFASNEKSRYKYWEKILLSEVVAEIYAQIESQKSAKENNDSTYVEKSMEEIEKEARETVLNKYEDYFDRLEKLRREDYFSMYINSITTSSDLHSQYFAPKPQKDLNMHISGELEGIGATLSQRMGEIKIVNVIAGGPAWKHGELKAGDIILKAATPGETPVSLADMRLDDAVELIRGKKGTIVILTIKKVDGTIKEISIVRDKVIIEDSYIRSLILKDSLKKNSVAYISLPSFYINFNSKSGRRCSKDFLKELTKIKDKNVDGIIIDLRNNGGGSLDEVIKIAGFFITKGPIVQVKNTRNKITKMGDNDASIVYDGNVLILTNQFSASASEIFAAAIQDYNRGIVFGTPQTHGKGTVQTIVDFSNITNSSNLGPLGALKLTIQKYYRINGGSTQIKGVKSDITFNTIYSFLDIYEKSVDNHLEWDEIPASKYQKWILPYNVDSLRKWSNTRMDSDSIFMEVNKYAKYLEKSKDINKIPLNFDKYSKIVSEKAEITKNFDKFMGRPTPLILNYLIDDSLAMQKDTLMKYRYDDWRNIKKVDYELNEAFNIVVDMKKFK